MTCTQPGLSLSRLSMFLREGLVLVGSCGACWMGPNVDFFPFFPSSFSTSWITQMQFWLFNNKYNTMHFFNFKDSVDILKRSSKLKTLTFKKAALTIRDAGLLKHSLKRLMCFSKCRAFSWVPPPTWELNKSGTQKDLSKTKMSFGYGCFICTHRLSLARRPSLDSLRVVPCGSLFAAAHRPGTGQCRGRETCHRWQSPTTVHQMLRKEQGS